MIPDIRETRLFHVERVVGLEVVELPAVIGHIYKGVDLLKVG